jgi:hypothetical protein
MQVFGLRNSAGILSGGWLVLAVAAGMMPHIAPTIHAARLPSAVCRKSAVCSMERGAFIFYAGLFYL